MDNGRSGVIYDFGGYQVDPVVRRVYSGSETLPLTPKAFDTLLILIANRGKVVLKAELIDRLWPDIAVEENNLTQQIATLRRCFGERAGDHRYIVTVPGKGYSFVAPVNEVANDKETSCDPIGQPRSPKEGSPNRFAVWARSGGGFGAMLAAAYIILVCLTSIVAYQNDTGRSDYATTVVVMGFSASDGYDSAIGAGIRDTLPGIALATVHGILNDLTDAAVVQRVNLPDVGSALYELRSDDNHHHLQCVSCGRVEDVACAVGAAPCLHPSHDHGMRILEAAVTYRALCHECERNGNG